MKKTILLSIVTLFSASLMSQAAHAGGWHDNGWRYDRGERHHYRHHERNGVYFNIIKPPRAYYPRHYYSKAYYPPVQRVVYVPQPVYYPQAQVQNMSSIRYCREFTRDIIIGGRVQQGYGTACQQPDGSWVFSD